MWTDLSQTTLEGFASEWVFQKNQATSGKTWMGSFVAFYTLGGTSFQWDWDGEE
jgi:hypothetical protein